MTQLGRMSQEDYRCAEKIPLTLVLENIRSGVNVGSAFRSSDAFRIEKILCCGITPVPPHREVLKTALGATENVAWEYTSDIKARLAALKEKGSLIVAVEQTTKSMPLTHFEWPDKPIVLVLGNEVTGISDDTLALCDQAVEIIQYGTKHSLNVAVCAGIVLFEMRKKYTEKIRK